MNMAWMNIVSYGQAICYKTYSDFQGTTITAYFWSNSWLLYIKGGE